MTTFSSSADNAYAYTRIGVQTGVVSASPHQLTLMLYDGAIATIAAAQQQMRLKNTAAKGAAISKAISIIDDGLKASLDLNVGGQMAQNLFELYLYMSQRLVYANLKNDSAALGEVAQLLQQLRGAWQSIATKDAAAKPIVSAPAQTPPLASGSVNQSNSVSNATSAQTSDTAVPNPTSPQSRVAAAYGAR